MCGAWKKQRTLIAFVLLAVTTSPSATLNTVISGIVTAPVSLTLTHVPVLAGSDAEMPCDTRPPVRNDSLLLVVWYRDDNPVYSYDTRPRGAEAHWIEEPYIGRAHWHTTPISGLRLRNVQSHDRAVYNCRVDFRVSQTRNYGVALDVVDLPGKPIVFDEYGKEVVGMAGPFLEGQDFKLICTVNGGYPSPRIQWLQGDKELKTLKAVHYQFIEDYQPSRSLTLVIKNATRAHLFTTYGCFAENTVLAPGQRTDVQIDLYLKPLTVEIMTKEQPISVDRRSEILCKTIGARPAAIVTWWLAGNKLDTSITEMSSDANTTESLLQWIPLKEHNGQTLTCRAEHPKFNHSSIESKLRLNVFYTPEATIHLGAKMNPNDIEEGDDVYFGCKIDANPPVYKVIWEHNGVQLQHNPSYGIIITGNTNLALRNISRSQAGHYTCTASNVEGDGSSRSLLLQVVYKPLCKDGEVKILGVAIEESAAIICEVYAYPAPGSFEWTLNNSAGSNTIEAEHYTIHANEGRSVLSYTPISDTNYGTLSCRATNLAGQQTTPCLFTLLPATIPEQPRNCTVYNLTDDALDLICLPGYGTLKCTYVVEVWADEDLVKNASSADPSWTLRSVKTSRNLRLVVYAINSIGRSEYAILIVENTLKLSSRTNIQETWELNWAIGMFIGAVFTVSLILCLVLAARLRNKPRDYGGSIPTLKSQKVILQTRSSLQNSEEKNPDIIPLSKGPPDPPQYSTIVATTQPTKSSSNHSLSHIQTPASPLSSHVPFITQQNLNVQGDFGRTISNGVVRHREIVTTRAPLLASQQESCV